MLFKIENHMHAITAFNVRCVLTLIDIPAQRNGGKGAESSTPPSVIPVPNKVARAFEMASRHLLLAYI
jgi:hypothetical protein